MAIAAAVITLLAIVLLWWIFRFYPEKKAAEHFFDAVVAGDTPKAYELWKPLPTYRMEDFLADWGPHGYYGPVKSFKIVRADSPPGSNAVQISVALSPFSPMPDATDPNSHKTRLVAVWVVSRDKSLSFPP